MNNVGHNCQLCDVRLTKKNDCAIVDLVLGPVLCTQCLRICELENAHSDGHHIDEPDEECPDCQHAAKVNHTAEIAQLTEMAERLEADAAVLRRTIAALQA